MGRRSFLLASAVTGCVTMLAVSAVPAAAGDDAPPAAKREPKQRYLKVKRVRPKHGRARVDVDSQIQILFSEPIQADTVTSESVGLAVLFGELAEWTPRLESNGRLLILTPNMSLEPSKDYEVDVRPGVLSLTGRTLRRAKSSLFFTQGRPGAGVLRADQFVDLAARMIEPRASHTASLLANGNVVLAGGNTDATAFAVGCDVYVPEEQRFRFGLNLLPTQRAFHQAVVANDEVHLIGGWDGTDATATTDTFLGGPWISGKGPEMLEKRDFLAAVTLADGRILVTGGLSYPPTGARYSQSAEILENGAFRRTAGNPIRRRAAHTLSLLPDGKVLVLGGMTALSGFSATAEIFDPETETFTETAPASYHRQLHSTTVLPNGLVLAADGGASLLEIYDREQDRWFEAAGASYTSRVRATASLLESGDVLLVGGIQTLANNSLVLDSMDLFVASSGERGRVFRVAVYLSQPRAMHTATVLATGQVLIAGGVDPAGGTNWDTATMFTPDAPETLASAK